MAKNTPPLTNESRREGLGLVDLIDPDGNLVQVSTRHQADHGKALIESKLAAGWKRPAEKKAKPAADK